MISAFVNARTLGRATKRIPLLLFRTKTKEACATTDVPTNSVDPDMPVMLDNPFKKERKLCILCKLNIQPDFKNVRLLSQFQSRYTGRIYGRHITGLCEHKQKRVEEEIKKAQTAGLMGHMTKEPKFCNDPMLFNPNFPFRKHKY